MVKITRNKGKYEYFLKVVADCVELISFNNTTNTVARSTIINRIVITNGTSRLRGRYPSLVGLLDEKGVLHSKKIL